MDHREQAGYRLGRPSSEEERPHSVYWRVEGSLLNLSAVRPVAFFTWNAQSFAERWVRRGAVALIAASRPLLYATDRVQATRVLHAVLRGVSRDRLDLLGEEYFRSILQPRLKKRGVEKLKQLLAAGHRVVLVSQGLDHVMRPLAEYLGAESIVCNRLDFRDGLATGRLLDPVLRPRGGLAWITGRQPDGRIPPDKLRRFLGLEPGQDGLETLAVPVRQPAPVAKRPVVLFEGRKQVPELSVRCALAGKRVLLIGATGFIGKVWLAKLLRDLPEMGRIYLLIRARSGSAVRRFEKMVEESPVFDSFHERYGSDLPGFMAERVEVLEGDVSQPGLGLDAGTQAYLARTVHLVVNSSGLTDFNPDLRTALAANVDAALNLLEFLRRCDHAALLHLSTCFVVGARDGRIYEELRPNYTPAGVRDYDAEREYQRLHELAKHIEAEAEGEEVTAALERGGTLTGGKSAGRSAAAASRKLQKSRSVWVRGRMVEAGMKRAAELGWPNTYTFTKSLAESLIAGRGAGLPIAIVRPSIVETSTSDPFRGWNEGVNTSAPLSYLLGTYFRQLPSNERKRLDIIPVDLVCRGMMLVSAALVKRCHQPVYQLATSGRNPCDMRRSIELTCLAHRKYYSAQEGLKPWLRARFETIPVSKKRYEWFSAPGQKAVVRALQKLSRLLPVARHLARKERGLDRLEKLIELYEPFILHNEQVFEGENVQLLAAGLVPEERAAFDYDAEAINWWDYWINIHIPALRKWSYPLITGQPLEAPPPRSFQMPKRFQAGAAR